MLDVNLFEWNKTDLSRKMGRCHDDPMKFISKFTFYVGYDGKVNQDAASEPSTDDESIDDSDTSRTEEPLRHAMVTQHDSADPADEPPAQKRRRLEHKDPMDDTTLEKKIGSSIDNNL